MTKTKNDTVAPATDDETTTEITFSAKDLAAECGVDAKAFRRWLRSHTADRANKGGRWKFTAEAKAELLAAFAARNAPASTTDQPVEG